MRGWGDGLERVSLIWIACLSTRLFHLCSTYQHGKYCAGVRALELPRVAGDSTQYGTGRQEELPEAAQARAGRSRQNVVRTNLDRQYTGTGKRTKGEHFQAKIHAKGYGVEMCRDRVVLVIAKAGQEFKLSRRGMKGHVSGSSGPACLAPATC
jgi:hypothetical protein